VNDEPRQLTSEARERVNMAKAQGGLCAGCGRELGADEPVYVARVWIGMKLFGNPTSLAARIFADAPFGVECISPGFRAEAEGVEPERCAWCGRGVYYEASRPQRRRAICSVRCRHRLGHASRQRKR
jgi:hypothetical protein